MSFWGGGATLVTVNQHGWQLNGESQDAPPLGPAVLEIDQATLEELKGPSGFHLGWPHAWTASLHLE